jgi:NAD(P)-dependent dehydrogenase (short-subunit alcohol dehydrogenase family)
MSTRLPVKETIPGDRPVLSGQAALITGASRGIGLAIASRLGRLGASVAICARKREGVERAAAALRDQGVRALPIVADVTRTDDIERMIEEASGQLGEIEILVNNAGIGIFGPFHEGSEPIGIRYSARI